MSDSILPQIQARVESVGPKNGQRQVSLNVGGSIFDVFDGYKQSEQGVMQVASPEWIESMDVPAVLMATMTVDVTPSEMQSGHVEPATNDPTGWQDHTFHGTIESLHKSAKPLLQDVFLFDGVTQDESGGRIDSAAYEDVESAVLRLNDGSILVDISNSDVELSVEDSVSVTTSRIDLIGYRQRYL